MDYSPKKINEEISNNNFKIKKKFGQNFISDYNTIHNIVDKALIEDNSLVIEIGPGIGSLTSYLCKKAKWVLCYEIDKDVEPILKDNIDDNVEIIFKDFLKANVKDDIKKYNYNKLYVIANLPYYITTPIILKVIEDRIDVDKIIVMVQKEVGNRIGAKPNTRDYSSLSVYINYYYDVKKLLDVSRNIFIPVPNVDSIVIEMKKKDNRLKVNDEELFFRLVRDSFKYKRKNLRNNLKNYNLDIISNIVTNYGYDLSVRAEQLSIDIFVDIANNLG